MVKIETPTEMIMEEINHIENMELRESPEKANKREIKRTNKISTRAAVFAYSLERKNVKYSVDIKEATPRQIAMLKKEKRNKIITYGILKTFVFNIFGAAHTAWRASQNFEDANLGKQEKAIRIFIRNEDTKQGMVYAEFSTFELGKVKSDFKQKLDALRKGRKIK